MTIWKIKQVEVTGNLGTETKRIDDCLEVRGITIKIGLLQKAVLLGIRKSL